MLTTLYTKQIGLLNQLYCFMVTAATFILFKKHCLARFTTSIVVGLFYKVIEFNITFLHFYKYTISPIIWGNTIILVEYYEIV